MPAERSSTPLLDSVLHPLAAERFYRDYWGREFLHLPGPPDKFAHLFSWETLNRALETHHFGDRRLRLFRAKKEVPHSKFMNGAVLDPNRLRHHLAAGAALILNNCDQLHAPLGAVCRELEETLNQRVLTNLYAGWRNESGFGVHWDQQSILILQIAGRKRWKFWRPQRPDPLKDDVVDTSAAPGGEPFYDIVLEPGSLLAFPRGWWHDVIPVGEPCLHLTVTVPARTGIDLLNWVAGLMRESDAARMEVPVTAGTAERAEWLASVKRDLDALWDDSLTERFIHHSSSSIPVRPSFALPDLGVGESKWVKLATPGQLRLNYRDGHAELAVGNTKWRLTPALAARILVFNDRKPRLVSEVFDPASRLMAGALTLAGVLEFCAAPESD